MLFSRALWSLAIATGALAQSQYLQEQLSFGHTGLVSADRRDIPNFVIAGSPSLPTLLSDRLILTPVSPGNHRGSVWAQKPLNHLEWTADVDFRAAGQGRVGGNLQIWLVKDGQQEVGMSSIYTVATFDGLALVIDTYGGTGGTVRGFLNDGLSVYKNHHSVDSLAFGHCARAYRNLGRTTQIKIEQSRSNFKVSIDGELCFESPKIRIPQGYYLGVTAASTDDPDSFEIFKLVVTTSSMGIGSAASTEQDVPQQPKVDLSGMFIGKQEDLPEQAAESISQEKQFADLHYRLQALMKHITMFQRDFQLYQRESDRRHEELKLGRVLPTDQLAALNQRMEAMERNLEQIKKAVGDVDYPKHMEDLKRTIGEHHSNLIEGMTGPLSKLMQRSSPQLGFFVFVIVGSQALLALAYIIYKRRRSMMPKKYL